MNSFDNDFITFPADSFRFSPDYMSNHFEQFKFINNIASLNEETIGHYVLGFVLFFYLRIISCSEDLDLVIGPEEEPSTLRDIDDLFVDIFKRTETICRQNRKLATALGVLKPFFMDAAAECSDSLKEYAYTGITTLDWRRNAFTGPVHQMVEKDIWGEAKKRLTRIFPSDNQVVGLYVFDDLIGDVLHGSSCVDHVMSDPYFLSSQIDMYLTPSKTDKILCPSDLYMVYLMNLLEKNGWPLGVAGDRMWAVLKDVHCYETNRLLWALHTLQLPLFGYRQALDGRTPIADGLMEIAETDFDHMVLPQVTNDNVPDVGPIDLGDVEVHLANPLYCLAYWYTRLNPGGRMHVLVGECHSEAEKRVIAHLIDRDEIEAAIQYYDVGIYLIINRQKPLYRAGKVLFYYTSRGYIQNMEAFKKCYQNWSWDPSETRHSEGAIVVSGAAIRLKNFLITPKEYVFDYSAIMNNGEFEVVSHISHNVAPRIASVASIIKHLKHFIDTRGLANELLQEVFFEEQPRETIASAITKAQEDITHINRLMQETRKIITTEIAPDDFKELDLVEFLKSALAKYAESSFTVETAFPTSEMVVQLHPTAVRELLDNVIRNAEVHGFAGVPKPHRLLVALLEDKEGITLEVCNNGTPFSQEFTEADYLAFGRKRKGSPGDGLGGAFVYKVLRQHGWGFELVRNLDDYTAGVRIKLPKRRVL